LLEKAKTLFNCYGHPHAFENALAGSFPDDERMIHRGDKWAPLNRDSSSLDLGKEKKTKSKKDKAIEVEEENITPFEGDQALAQSCRFMYHATISREVIYATAEGDTGRVWEAVKVRIPVSKCICLNRVLVHDIHIRRINTYQVHELSPGDVVRS